MQISALKVKLLLLNLSGESHSHHLCANYLQEKSCQFFHKENEKKYVFSQNKSDIKWKPKYFAMCKRPLKNNAKPKSAMKKLPRKMFKCLNGPFDDEELTVLDVLLSVEEPVRNLVLTRVLHDGHDLLNLLLGELASALAQVHIGLEEERRSILRHAEQNKSQPKISLQPTQQ